MSLYHPSLLPFPWKWGPDWRQPSLIIAALFEAMFTTRNWHETRIVIASPEREELLLGDDKTCSYNRSWCLFTVIHLGK